MKKIFKGMLLSLLLISSSASLSGCFGFGDEAMEISSITTVTLENGDIQVIITYVDEDTKPTTFVVPKGDSGEDGKDGNGIKEITYTQSEDKQTTLVNIAFTQENVDPVEVKVPNGVSVTGIDQTFDEETQLTTLIVNFSDGTKSDPILIPKGEKGDDGKDGISVLGIEQTLNEDLSKILTFKMSDGNDVFVTIPAPIKGEDGQPGKDGKEITAIVSRFDKELDSYVYTVTYNDESTTEFEVERQNKWFTEDSKPTKDDGINGDLWYDVNAQIIYIKENNSWKEVINFDILKAEEFTVRFELNDSPEEPGKMPNTKLDYEEYDDIDKGSYFTAEGYTIPVPTRDGYDFIGWYTTKGILNPTHSAFTDLTPVMCDLTLYAHWVKSSEE